MARLRDSKQAVHPEAFEEWRSSNHATSLINDHMSELRTRDGHDDNSAYRSLQEFESHVHPTLFLSNDWANVISKIW